MEVHGPVTLSGNSFSPWNGFNGVLSPRQSQAYVSIKAAQHTPKYRLLSSLPLFLQNYHKVCEKVGNLWTCIRKRSPRVSRCYTRSYFLQETVVPMYLDTWYLQPVHTQQKLKEGSQQKENRVRDCFASYVASVCFHITQSLRETCTKLRVVALCMTRRDRAALPPRPQSSWGLCSPHSGQLCLVEFFPVSSPYQPADDVWTGATQPHKSFLPTAVGSWWHHEQTTSVEGGNV